VTNANQTSPTPTFTYRVVRGSIKRPRVDQTRVFVGVSDFYNQGDLIPDGVYDQEDIASWLAGGRIAEAGPEEDATAQARIKPRGKWIVDPATLVGKTMEELLLLVSEIDPSFHTSTLEDERAAVVLLTSDCDPRHAQIVAVASDRSKPALLRLGDLEQSSAGPAVGTSNPRMSDASRAALARARERAQAPAEAHE